MKTTKTVKSQQVIVEANDNDVRNKVSRRGTALTPRVEMNDRDKARLKTILEAFRYFKLMTKTRREFIINMYDQLVVNGRTPTIHQMEKLRDILTFTNMQIFPNDGFTVRRVHDKSKRESIVRNINTSLQGRVHPSCVA